MSVENSFPLIVKHVISGGLQLSSVSARQQLECLHQLLWAKKAEEENWNQTIDKYFSCSSVLKYLWDIDNSSPGTWLKSWVRKAQERGPRRKFETKQLPLISRWRCLISKFTHISIDSINWMFCVIPWHKLKEKKKMKRRYKVGLFSSCFC